MIKLTRQDCGKLNNIDKAAEAGEETFHEKTKGKFPLGPKLLPLCNHSLLELWIFKRLIAAKKASKRKQVEKAKRQIPSAFWQNSIGKSGPSRFPSSTALGKSLRGHEISWAMDFPISPKFWWSMDTFCGWIELNFKSYSQNDIIIISNHHIKSSS